MASKIYTKDLRRAAQLIKEANALVVTCGAGMGVDSGLPDFRGAEGFWKAYPPLKKRGLSLPQTSTPHWFEEDPTFAWGFFGHRLQLYRKTTPHKGFNILQTWCKKMEHGHFVFTSNVDGHFQKAGFSEDQVVECHGSLNYLQCVDSRHSDAIWPFPENFEINVDDLNLRLIGEMPKGPPDAEKKTLARPNVLMFGDWGWVGDRTEAQYERLETFNTNAMEKGAKLVVVEIGAGLAVPTVRFKSEELVNQDRARRILIRINPMEPQVPDENDVSLPMKGLEALSEIDAILEEL